jgi:hypothetical protein
MCQPFIKLVKRRPLRSRLEQVRILDLSRNTVGDLESILCGLGNGPCCSTSRVPTPKAPAATASAVACRTTSPTPFSRYGAQVGEPAGLGNAGAFNTNNDVQLSYHHCFVPSPVLAMKECSAELGSRLAENQIGVTLFLTSEPLIVSGEIVPPGARNS